jgi:hypothetical protein
VSCVVITNLQLELRYLAVTRISLLCNPLQLGYPTVKSCECTGHLAGRLIGPRQVDAAASVSSFRCGGIQSYVRF